MYLPSVTSPITSGSFTSYRVAATGSVVTLFSGSQFARRGGTVFNHSNASLYIGLWTDVGPTKFMVKLTSGSYYELPTPVYMDAIYGSWDASGGHAMIVDLLAND